LLYLPWFTTVPELLLAYLDIKLRREAPGEQRAATLITGMLGVLGVCGLLPSPVHLVQSSGTTPRAQRLPRAAIEEPHARLILVRHGQSEWNRANRFTGWADVDLTEVGISDAREAGKLLAAEGLEVDEVHTSLMRRAVRSAVLMLSTLNQCWWLWRFERARLSAAPRFSFLLRRVPVRKHLQLNEQHSGSLTGKIQCDSNLRP